MGNESVTRFLSEIESLRKDRWGLEIRSEQNTLLGRVTDVKKDTHKEQMRTALSWTIIMWVARVM